MVDQDEVQKVWDEFWVPTLDAAVEGQELGQSIAIPGVYFEQIKKELFDFHVMIDGLLTLYDEITGGRCSKPNTDKRVVAELVEERVRDSYYEGYDDGREEGYDEGYENGYFSATGDYPL